MLVFRGVQIRKLDRLLKAPDLKVSEVNYILMVGRWWKSRWFGLFQGSVTPRTSEKNPHHLIGTVFCRSRSQHINNSIYIYIHILYQGDLKNQLENKRRRRCSWFILQIWMISENSGFFAPNHPFLDMVFSNRNQSNLGCFPYFGISTQIWMRKLLSRWRRIPPLRRCCAPWSNRRRWSKLNETGGVVGSIKQLGTAKLGGGVILERWICCFSWKLGGISLVWSPRFLVWPFFLLCFLFWSVEGWDFDGGF